MNLIFVHAPPQIIILEELLLLLHGRKNIRQEININVGKLNILHGTEG